MIKEIRYDKTYILNKDNYEIGFMNFSRSEDEYTYMTVTVISDGKELSKSLLLTKERTVDEYDVQSVNEILNTQGLTFSAYK
ncbi:MULTISPECIES: hypothetical protein [Staphylococcus]|uniref:Uncharacterized protein n=2 Tax=Staphylococcus TaxID=1279 RepID=A0ABX3Z2I3_9STAP|nr:MULTISPECIES: hypothetical protein [Staphylococcus]AJC95819.1 hypothetical protein SHYC_05315 [Staphylococcus hyicus]MDG4943902.1 hypothetical protein [Staphylococcus agnetis]MDP4462576.1 hypothetical protein [Staphylococcus hyicus]MDP4468643.1 hypothetical protein [Staphylococcus hyicus]MDY3698791.1 hypothetical protein [Staphylococcus hyicus]